MLKKTGQLWILFVLCLVLIVPAMVWLTVKAVRLDNDLQEDRIQTELARQEAEIQEKITSALYRMDWKLGPHIAREVARPYYLYSAFYSSLQGLPAANNDSAATSEAVNFLGVGSGNEIPSPLLSQTSEFVQLHFQIDSNNNFTSPQRPPAQQCEKAMACCGVTDEIISNRDAQLAAAKELTDFASLNARIAAAEMLEGEQLVQNSGNVYLQPQIANYLSRIKEQAANNSAQPFDGQVQQQTKSELQRIRGQDRGGKEFVKRQEAYNVNTIEWADNNRSLGNSQQAAFLNIPAKNNLSGSSSASTSPIVEGIMRPIWIGDELLLVRRVSVQGSSVLQCCWLAWDIIQAALRQEVSDILPVVEFLPIRNEESLEPSRALVTLPVQLRIDAPALLATTAIVPAESKVEKLTGIRVAIFLAWAGLMLSALATAMLLRGLVQLSERRAAFVSAVTHELRTPLTTFKMYSEMLAEKMVPPDKLVQYAETLRSQADRLCHLVENVLQYARLERGPRNETKVSKVGTLLEGIEERLKERTVEAGMDLSYQVDPEMHEVTVRVEPHVIEQVLFNLVDNACKYAKNSNNRTIEVHGRRNGQKLEFSVRDFGPGISKRLGKRLFRPFLKSDLDAANSEPGVGLGLALCQRMARSAHGRLQCENCGDGTRFILSIPTSL